MSAELACGWESTASKSSSSSAATQLTHGTGSSSSSTTSPISWEWHVEPDVAAQCLTDASWIQVRVRLHHCCLIASVISSSKKPQHAAVCVYSVLLNSKWCSSCVIGSY
jgi:hypothetical protein